MGKAFLITRSDNKLGDHLMATKFVHMLNYSGLKAAYSGPYEYIADCPTKDSLSGYNIQEHSFIYETYPTLPIFEVAVVDFKEKNNVSIPITEMIDYIPVKFREINIEPVDVALITQSGNWSRYRDWPYFPELKYEFSKRGITYLDLSESNIQDFALLNYIKKSSLFIGLETGATHLASSFLTKDTALVIQGGYSYFNYWANYSCTVIEAKQPCSDCRRRNGCDRNQKCMTDISVDLVLQWTISALSKNAMN